MKSGIDVLNNFDCDSQKNFMKNPKKDNIHHFADEFALEDLKHESEVESVFHADSYLTKDRQFSMIMKQISHLKNRIDRLEKMLEKNS